jgi:hypothetical protein
MMAPSSTGRRQPSASVRPPGGTLVARESQRREQRKPTDLKEQAAPHRTVGKGGRPAQADGGDETEEQEEQRGPPRPREEQGACPKRQDQGRERQFQPGELRQGFTAWGDGHRAAAAPRPDAHRCRSACRWRRGALNERARTQARVPGERGRPDGRDAPPVGPRGWSHLVSQQTRPTQGLHSAGHGGEKEAQRQEDAQERPIGLPALCRRHGEHGNLLSSSGATSFVSGVDVSCEDQFRARSS